MNVLALLPNLAGPQGWIIVLIALVLFGGKRLPDVGKSLGETMRQFRKGKNPEDENKP